MGHAIDGIDFIEQHTSIKRYGDQVGPRAGLPRGELGLALTD
jgi:hypothetical protein